MLVERVAAEVVARAHAFCELKPFLDAALRETAQLVGCDSALLMPETRTAPGTLNKGPEFKNIYHQFRAGQLRYRAELRRGRAIALQRGAYIDNEVYSVAERSRLSFYNEIIAPQGVRDRIVGYVAFHGRVDAVIHLCRHGRGARFVPRELDAIRQLLPTLGLAYAAFRSQNEDAPALDTLGRLERLTAREHQIVNYVRRGYHNKEIASLLGSSPLTVRNQLSEVFRKLELSGRSALAAHAERHMGRR